MMISFCGASDPDVQAILSDPTISSMLQNMFNYRDRSTSQTEPIRALRRLDRDSEYDRTWWDRTFNPTREEVREGLLRSLHSPLHDFIREHPEFLLGPVSLGLQGLETAGAIAVQRVAPRLLAIGAVSGSWESFVNYMKGGKEGVTRAGKGDGGGGKERKFDTQAERDEFVKSKVSSGEFVKHHKMLDGKPTWRNTNQTRYYHKSIEKWEIEVYDQNGRHIGVIKPSDGVFHPEMAVQGRKINVR